MSCHSHRSGGSAKKRFMTIRVLVFESDAAFASELENGLSGFGCQTAIVDDANAGLQAAASDKPDLILLSIELPRMNGFSVCNKLKRDPTLKDVPLIIMSSDSTDETFEQHRRLRTRAEDYVHKPVGFQDLLGRIRQFVPLDAELEAAVEEEPILIDDEIEIADEEIAETRASRAPSLPPESSVDADVDDFAEQAFGALIDPNAPTSIAPSAASSPPPAMSASGSLAPAPSTPPASKAVNGAAVANGAAVEAGAHDGAAQVHAEQIGALEARVAELQAALAEETERAARFEERARVADAARERASSLEREIEEVKQRAAGAKGGTAREFLDLREALNKKDKELLDLRDQLTHRDKELLNLRDASLGLEREKADLLDRMSEPERQAADLQKLADAARADKDQASKRADDFKRKLEKIQADFEGRTQEIETLRADVERAQAEQERLSAEHREALEAALAEQRQAHEATLAEQRQAHESAPEELRRVAERKLETALGEAAETLEKARTEAAEALERARATAETERTEAVARREAELRAELDARL